MTPKSRHDVAKYMTVRRVFKLLLRAYHRFKWIRDSVGDVDARAVVVEPYSLAMASVVHAAVREKQGNSNSLVL